MARIKQTAGHYEKDLITWTRFHLPQDQEWPTWSVDHADVHVGPLAGVHGFHKASLGRMVDNPEQAAYIIEWATLDDLNNFQSSAACADFLRSLPEHDDSQVSFESGLAESALGNLTLDDASPPSRFLTLKHVTEAITSPVAGRVTLTAFLIPSKVDSIWKMWDEDFEPVFRSFIPRDSQLRNQFIRTRNGSKPIAVWFGALAEDRWVERKFGKPEQTQDGDQGRTIFCDFHLWSPDYGASPEHEEASATDPQARESWAQAIARVMPPATAWTQERWDIQEVPRFYPPEPEWDPEYPVEDQIEERRLLEEYLRSHGFEAGGRSQ
ncbi:hypothetical protein F5Y14DRAFT_423017 [Nemania sp. NC0429]|nr:hypothetical protein F5Y14DRAFT_423017 [Nemania sp. NC0429]